MRASLSRALHEEVSFDDLGGADVHGTVSGISHFTHDSEPACLMAVRELLGYIPSNNLDEPPLRPSEDPEDRADEAVVLKTQAAGGE